MQFSRRGAKRPLRAALAALVLGLGAIQFGAQSVEGGATDGGLVAHWTFDETSGDVVHDLLGQHSGVMSSTGASFVAGGVSGGALLLDRAQGGMVVVPHISEIATNDFTVVAWARLPAGDITPNTFLCSQCEAWFANGFSLILNQHSGGLIASKASFFVTANDKWITSTSSINDGAWHQIVGTYAKGGEMALYVDGSPAERSIASGPLIDRGAPFLIGAYYGVATAKVPAPYYSGWIDDIQLYRSALSETQVELLYRNPGRNLATITQNLLCTPDSEFIGSVQVILASVVPGADIRYTLDGSDPTPASARYQGVLEITRTTTLKARLYIGSTPASDMITATYTRLPDIMITPAGGFFTNMVNVTLTNTVGIGTLLCTLDGSDPAASSPAYAGPIQLTASATLKARLFMNGYPVSDVVQATFSRVYALDDGVPNDWREQHFGAGYLTDPRVGALTDPDGDGASNLQEYLVGTDPLDPLSGFTLEIQAVPMLKWHSVPNRVYVILRKFSLDDPSWVVVVPEYRAVETISAYTDIEVAGRRAYYLIELKPE